MGSYTFKWDLPAEEVFVTGTFDNWTKSEKLDKVGDVFTKTVSFQDASKKIYYKFVVDHAWIISESSPKEADHEGNVNNFLTPEDMASEEPVAQAIAPETAESTIAQPASEQPVDKVEEPKVEAEQATEQVEQPAENVEQPVEKEQGDEKPETVESAEKEEEKNAQAEEDDIVKRTANIATPSDVPGGFPASPPDNEEKTFSISPLPAAAGAVNPIKLAPGEPVPDVFVESVNDHVKLDEASYEKSDALPGVDLAELQPPSVSADVIPESDLPVADAFAAQINTIGPTTLGLAAEVPLEAKVPAIVKESQEEAGFAPEASAVPEEVREKAQVEEELLDKIPEVPATAVSAPAEVPEAEAAIPAEVVSADAPAEQAAPVAQEDKPAEVVAEVPSEVHEEPAATTSTAAAVEEKKAEEVVAAEPVEEKQDEVKAEEAAAETEAETAQTETKAETTEPAEPISAAVAAEPVAVEAAAAPAEPESAGPTQVDESAEAAPVAPTTEETAPVAEAPDADATPQTPRSEGTEVSPNAEANGSEEKSDSTPSDKKRKSRLSSFFSRILFRAKPSDK